MVLTYPFKIPYGFYLLVKVSLHQTLLKSIKYYLKTITDIITKFIMQKKDYVFLYIITGELMDCPNIVILK